LSLQLGWRSLVNSLLGAAIGAGALYAIGWVYLKLRKVQGMGLGDVKLMAMAGSFLGPLLTLFVLCTASLLGGIYGVFLLLTVFRQRLVRYRASLGTQAPARAWQAANVALQGLEIPFGVFLCVMSLVAWFYGVAFIRGYLRLLLIPG
jgi:leader peptidase (prepilin peptidase)/N-methyltransferase